MTHDPRHRPAAATALARRLTIGLTAAGTHPPPEAVGHGTVAAPPPRGSGTFRRYDLQAPIGMGTYRTRAHGDSTTLVDIPNVRRLRWVVRGGRIYESAALWRPAGSTP